MAISGDGLGMERDWAAESRAWQRDLPTPEEVGRLAGERAVGRVGARKPATGAFPVVLDERVAGSLIGHVLAATNGSSIVRGSSWLRNAMGRQILPAGMTVREDPHRPAPVGIASLRRRRPADTGTRHCARRRAFGLDA